MPIELAPGVTVYVEPPTIPELLVGPSDGAGTPGPPGSTGPTGPPGPAGPAGSGGTGGILATIVDAKGDLIAGTANDTVARVPTGTVDGHVLTRNAAASTGMLWSAPTGGSGIPVTIVDVKGDLIAATAADVVTRLAAGSNGQVLKANSATTTGLEWADGSGAGPSVPWDTTVSNGVTRLNHGFDNIVANSNFYSWSAGTSAPDAWNQITATVLKVVGLGGTTGLHAAQVTFGGAFTELSQAIPGFLSGEQYTVTAKLEKVSGTGSVRLQLINDISPFQIYGVISPLAVTAGSGPQIVMFSALVSVSGTARLQFQSTDANGSVWKAHWFKIQRGTAVASEYTPIAVDETSTQIIYGFKNFIGGASITSAAMQTIARQASGNLYAIPVEGSYLIEMTVDNSIVIPQSKYDDVPRVINLLIKQDSVGNHPYRFSPSHIAWEGGMMSDNVNFDLSANSHTYVRLIWMGIMYGFYGQIVNSMPELYHQPATTSTHTYNAATGSAYGGITTQQLGFKMFLPRNIPVIERDWWKNGLLRVCSAAMRQRIAANDVTFEVSYLANSDGPRAMMSPDRPGDFPVISGGYYLNRPFGSSPGPAMVHNRSGGGATESWALSVSAHEICHAIEVGYYAGVNPPHPTHGSLPIKLHPALVTVRNNCNSNGAAGMGDAEWMAETLRQRQIPLDNGDPNAVPPTGNMANVLGTGTTGSTPAQRWADALNYLNSLGLV